MLFLDRKHAGEKLATELEKYRDDKNTIVLALPRGGVAVAHEICKQLHLPLDLMLVRKLGVPWQEELALGAIATGNVILFNEEILRVIPLSPDDLEPIIAAEKQELERRNRFYRGKKPFPSLTGKNVILIDDGVATGATMRAAIAATKEKKPNKIIVAVPVAAPSTCRELEQEADEVICLETPPDLYGIGIWYRDFSQLSDHEVIALLNDIQLENSAK